LASITWLFILVHLFLFIALLEPTGWSTNQQINWTTYSWETFVHRLHDLLVRLGDVLILHNYMSLLGVRESYSE
jgi:hypothetical protein